MSISKTFKAVKYNDVLDILSKDYMLEVSWHNLPNPDIPTKGPKMKIKDEGIPDLSQLDDESINILHKILDTCKKERLTPANLI